MMENPNELYLVIRGTPTWGERNYKLANDIVICPYADIDKTVAEFFNRGIFDVFIYKLAEKARVDEIIIRTVSGEERKITPQK